MRTIKIEDAEYHFGAEATLKAFLGGHDYGKERLWHIK